MDNTELLEAQKEIESLREHLSETKGENQRTAGTIAGFPLVAERLESMEEAHRNEEARWRSLTSEHDSLREELSQLKQRSTEPAGDHSELLEQQQLQLEHLSKSIVSKKSEHEQLLRVYLCFFLSCYLLIFFLFFCLLSW